MRWLLRALWLLIPLISIPAVAAPPQPAELLLTPYASLKIASDDVPATGPGALYWRYLVLPNSTPDRRRKLKQTADFVLNSLSKRRLITKTVALPNEQDPRVLRVDLNAYGITPQSWDDLAERGSGNTPLPESYHYVPIEAVVSWPGGVWESKYYEPGAFKYQKKSIQLAPWVMSDGGAAANKLLKAIGGYKAPILRCDWFVTFASWAPAYYRLLGVKTKQQELDDLFSVDEKKAANGLFAAVADSGIVALHNRILTRIPTVSGYLGGYRYLSFDTINGIDKADYLNNLDTFDAPTHDAREIIWSGPNNLQVYAVTDNKGNLQNVANPNVAIHGDTLPTRLKDKQVYAGLRNCALCHYGIQRIDCRVRAIAQGKIGLSQLFTGKIKDLQIQAKVTDAFSVDPKLLTDHDNALFAAAVFAVNGRTPAENATQLEQAYWDYLEAPITLEVAALEAGYRPEEIRALIRASTGVDHTLMGVAQQLQVPASRIHWERRGNIQLLLLTLPLKR